jgi:hypothetical protein
MIMIMMTWNRKESRQTFQLGTVQIHRDDAIDTNGFQQARHIGTGNRLGMQATLEILARVTKISVRQITETNDLKMGIDQKI